MVWWATWVFGRHTTGHHVCGGNEIRTPQRGMEGELSFQCRDGWSGRVGVATLRQQLGDRRGFHVQRLWARDQLLGRPSCVAVLAERF